MSRRASLEESDEQDWETEGSGFASGGEAEEMINRRFCELRIDQS